MGQLRNKLRDFSLAPQSRTVVSHVKSRHGEGNITHVISFFIIRHYGCGGLEIFTVIFTVECGAGMKINAGMVEIIYSIQFKSFIDTQKKSLQTHES